MSTLFQSKIISILLKKGVYNHIDLMYNGHIKGEQGVPPSINWMEIIMGNEWMKKFVESFKATHNGREPSKNEVKAATPLFVNIDHNPKGKGTMSWTRFQGYLSDETPTTIGEAMNNGVRQDDIRHDSDKRYILLGDEAQAMYDSLDQVDENEVENKDETLVDGETETK